jgi:hypothetical protein
VFVHLRQQKIEQLEQAADDELEASLLSLVVAQDSTRNED